MSSDVPKPATFRLLQPWEQRAEAEVMDSVTRRLPVALESFPALVGETIYIGRLTEYTDARGQAIPRNRLVLLPTDETPSNITLWHELAHCAIRVRAENGEDVAKTSEKFCSIYAIARMPRDAIDEDGIPYLGSIAVPQEEWPAICRDALEYREDHQDYIAYANDRLAGRERGRERRGSATDRPEVLG